MKSAQSRSTGDRELEQCLSQFESDWRASDDSRILRYLPAVDSGFYEAALVEMVRVDMELRWESGCSQTLQEYIERFPQLKDDPQALNQVAFEEYRLRFGQAGNRQVQVLSDSMALREEYSKNYGIEVADWPVWKRSSSELLPQRPSGKATRRSQFPQTGEDFCGFKLVGLLGEGACGRVFLARQHELANRLVSLKITRESSSESWHLAKLQHTNIIPVLSVHQKEDLTALCMPFLGMSTLKNLIAEAWSHKDTADRKSAQSLISTTNMARAQSVLETIRDPEDQQVFEFSVSASRDHSWHTGADYRWVDVVLELACGMADGLEHAHEKGLVHGDIKPANVLISDEQQPILLDFHLSRSTADGLQFADWIGGTLPYMAPEQLRSLDTGEAVDARSDLFSLGAVLYQMLTGELPFGGNDSDTIQEMIAARCQWPSPSIQSRCRGLSCDLDSIVAKCLAPKPEDRYQSARQLLTDLQLHRANRSLRYAPNRSWKEKTQKFVRRHPRLTSAASMGAITSILVLCLILALANRANRIATLQAADESRQFVEQLEKAKLAMSVITQDFESIERSQQETRRLLEQFAARTPEQWSHNPRIHRISATAASRERQRIGSTLFWFAESCRRSARGIQNPEQRSKLLDQALQDNARAEWFLAEKPTPAGIVLQRAQLLIAAGDSSTGEALVKEAEARPPQSALDALMATTLMESSPSSVQYAEQLMEQDGQNHTSWIVAARAMFMHGQKERGLACLQMAVSLEPENSHANWMLGRARFDAGDLHGALEAYQRVGPEDSAYLLVLMNQAIVWLNLGEPKAAEQALTDAIQGGANNSRIWFLRSQAWEMLGESSAAQADMKAFLEKKPCDELGYLTLGEQFVESNPQAAIRNFQQALQLNPRSATAIQNLAHVYSEVLGDLPEAIQWINQLVQLDDHNPVYLSYRGVLNARNGKRATALRDAHAALQIRRDADTLYRVAGIYAQTGRSEPADLVQAVNVLSEASMLNARLVQDYAKMDPDIEPLRGIKPYQELMKTIQELAVLDESSAPPTD